MDIDKSVVNTLEQGEPPAHEPELSDLIKRQINNRLHATTDYGAARAEM